ncbi:MAG: hypothetical protein QM622_07890 [Microbacterium sp.]
MSICDLGFPIALRITVAPASFEGMPLMAATDPLTSAGSFVRYELDGTEHYGYVQTRAAAVVRGRPWGMGLLYDVASTDPAEPPRPGHPLGRRFRQRAEVEFVAQERG